MNEILKGKHARVLSGNKEGSGTPFYRVQYRRCRLLPWPLAYFQDFATRFVAMEKAIKYENTRVK